MNIKFIFILIFFIKFDEPIIGKWKLFKINNQIIYECNDIIEIFTDSIILYNDCYSIEKNSRVGKLNIKLNKNLIYLQKINFNTNYNLLNIENKSTTIYFEIKSNKNLFLRINKKEFIFKR